MGLVGQNPSPSRKKANVEKSYTNKQVYSGADVMASVMDAVAAGRVLSSPTQKRQWDNMGLQVV